jgi:hypothetical protein
MALENRGTLALRKAMIVAPHNILQSKNNMIILLSGLLDALTKSI